MFSDRLYIHTVFVRSYCSTVCPMDLATLLCARARVLVHAQSVQDGSRTLPTYSLYHPTPLSSGLLLFSCCTCCVHTPGLRVARVCDCLCMHAATQKVGTARCFCKLTVCSAEWLSHYQYTNLMTLLSLFLPPPFLLSLCPGCRVFSPYLLSFVPAAAIRAL